MGGFIEHAFYVRTFFTFKRTFCNCTVYALPDISYLSSNSVVSTSTGPSRIFLKGLT
jgi:hypothetical protein